MSEAVRARDSSDESPPIAETEAGGSGAARLGGMPRIVAGMVAGVLVVGGLSFAVSWTLSGGRDAGESPAALSTVAVAGGEEPHQADQPLPAAVSERVSELRRTLASDPAAAPLRRELASTLIDNGDWVGGFNEARTLLRDDPDDATGLLVEGLVRMRMGQNEEGLLLLDRLLANEPDHIDALRVKGLGLLRLGDTDGAIASWERGLAAAGGREPEIERLLAVSRSARSGGENPATPPSRSGTTLPASLASVIASGQAIDAGSVEVGETSASFPITVEAPGVDAAGKILFVSLIEDGGGAPVLVRRVVSPQFPFEIALSSADNMLGEDVIPASGTVRVRLDGDGDVGTRGPGDMLAELAASRGTAIRVVLR